MLRLMVTVGADEWVFGFPQDDVVIGAARESGLVLAHDSVAARHARVSSRGGEVTLESLDTSRPARVNAYDIGRSVVREGDVIDIGVSSAV